MSKRTKKPSSAPWVLAAGAGLVMAASGVTGGAESGAAAATKPAAKTSTGSGSVVAQAAYDAGFRGERLVLSIAVAKAESGYKPKAHLRNGPTKGCPNGSTDRGIWEINDCYHPKVSNACAYDVACNAKAAFKISNGGKNWKPWSSFNAGKHLPFISEARNLAAGVS